LPRSSEDMKALRLGLMLTPHVRPVEAVGLLLGRLSHCLQHTTHLRQRQGEFVIGTFFSCSPACPCITTSAACASKLRVT